MILWPAILIVAYLAALIAGIVLSISPRYHARRRIIRIATAVLIVAPVFLALSLWGFLSLIFKEPPTLSDLQRDFASRRCDLETIVRMSDEDVSFSRVALDFIDRTSDNPNEFGRYMKGDAKAGLPKSRWEAYRLIYSRNNIKLGIQRNAYDEGPS